MEPLGLRDFRLHTTASENQHQKGVVMKQALKEKLENVVKHINNIMVDPDIDIDFCIPGVEMTVESSDTEADPYIIVNYTNDKYVGRKIKLNERYLQKSAEEIANLVTFSIEQFKEEIDSLK